MTSTRLHVYLAGLIMAVVGGVCGAQPSVWTFRASGKSFEVRRNRQEVVIRKDGQVVSRFHAVVADESSVVVADYNFDGIPDVAVVSGQGIERRFSVYVFDRALLSYRKNSVLSDLFCPVPNAADQTIVSYCSHGSTCESWIGTYRYARGGLMLIRKEITACDPASGEVFRTTEIYRRGKLVRWKTWEMPPAR